MKIISTAHYIPEKRVSNYDLSKFMDTSDEWIVEHTGIKNRYYAMGDENTSDLAFEVGKQLLEKSKLKADQIDLIIVSTISPDSVAPATANLLQSKLGIENAFSFDISSGCSGFLSALSLADKMLKDSKYKKALVIGAEVMSKTLDFKDRNSAVFFGDGAGGVLLEDDTSEDILIDEIFNTSSFNIEAIHSCRIAPIKELSELNYPKVDAFYQDGKAVYNFATTNIPQQINELLTGNNIKNKIDYVICHQANLRLIEKVSELIDIDSSKFFNIVEDFGNMSSAGIPIALSMLKEKIGDESSTILLSGFGAGLTYGSMLIQL